MKMFSKLSRNKRGQTALEYLLMLTVVLTLLVTVIAITNTIGGIGANVGAAIGDTKLQVLGWLMT